MNIHKVILPYTPSLIQDFFDDIERIEKKIANGGDYVSEIKRVENDSQKVKQSIQNK